MTMSVRRVERTHEIEVVTTYGTVTVTCREHASHLKWFWSELGRMIETIESEIAAESPGS